MTVRYDVYIHSKKWDQMLTRVSGLMSDAGLSAWMGSTVGPYLQQRAKQRFANEGDDVVGQWAPLRPATVMIRQDQGFGGSHPINNRTGELERWVTASGFQAFPNGGGASLRFPGSAPTGELRKKVQTAQVGDPKSRTVPRPVLGVNEADLVFVITALQFAVEHLPGVRTT